MSKLKKQSKSGQPIRYDLHRALPNATYQPSQVQTGHLATDQSFSQHKDSVKTRKFSWKKGLLVLFIAVLTPLLVIGVWDYRNAATASQKMFGTGNVTGALLVSPLEKNTAGRTNILLVGYSADDPGHAGALLTDSIMIVSMDKEQKSGYMLSVPRDLLVTIPDYGQAKINEAYQAGEQAGFQESGYPSGGTGLLSKVVSENFGITLHYHVIINYAAVRDIVNALGGVTVDIQSPDSRGLYDPNFKPAEGGPLKLANGPQKVDGQTALRLTRARGSTYGSYGFPQSDLNRTQNQQKVFAAIKNEMDWKLLLDPRLNERFFNAVANNIQTDMKLTEVLPMYGLVQAVPNQNLASVALHDFNGKNLLTSAQTRSGQSALVPAAGIKDFSEIKEAVNTLSQ